MPDFGTSTRSAEQVTPREVAESILGCCPHPRVTSRARSSTWQVVANRVGPSPARGSLLAKARIPPPVA